MRPKHSLPLSLPRRGFLAAVTAAVVAVATFSVPAPARAQTPPIDLGSGIVIDTLNLEGINYDAATGLLTATSGTVTGTIAGLPFTTDIENFQVELMPGTDEEEGCSVLDLQLAPINLALLGLHVDTSPICLSITAFQGQGLLGDLLCGLAGGDLDLLGGLPNVLTQVLNGTLSQGGPSQQVDPADDVCSGECDVLPLNLGPIDLTLLGLNVHLDDCDNGPVQVCVSATASEGLLGGLLCGLAGGGGGLLSSLGMIEDLVGTVTDALGGQTLTDRQTKQLSNRLTGQLTDRLQDGVLGAADLDKVTQTITQALR